MGAAASSKGSAGTRCDFSYPVTATINQPTSSTQKLQLLIMGQDLLFSLNHAGRGQKFQTKTTHHRGESKSDY